MNTETQNGLALLAVQAMAFNKKLKEGNGPLDKPLAFAMWGVARLAIALLKQEVRLLALEQGRTPEQVMGERSPPPPPEPTPPADVVTELHSPEDSRHAP